MTSLCQLDVRDNKLEGVLPDAVIRMKAKRECDVRLSGNEPGFSLPGELGGLGDSVVELNLSSCSLHGLLPNTLPKSLVSLVLDGNQFSGEIPVSWSHQETLERLSKVNCGILDSSGCESNGGNCYETIYSNGVVVLQLGSTTMTISLVGLPLMRLTRLGLGISELKRFAICLRKWKPANVPSALMR